MLGTQEPAFGHGAPGRAPWPPATKPAFSAGVYPPFGQVVQPSLETVRDGQYHEIQLPGTHQRDTYVEHWVFVAPTNNTAVPYVYVDRIVAIRA